LPAIEREMLDRWSAGRVFQRSLAQTADGPRWTAHMNPSGTSGMPGVHHVPARVVNDLFGRFKTMQGCYVPRRGGWDCHGLPVEVAVERELGLSGSKEIEEYGVGQFTARCRESARRHAETFAEMTARLGCWVDLADAYQTMDPAYIEAVWWSLKRLFDAGLLAREFRVSPYCPRCQTPLSDHELGLPDAGQVVPCRSVVVKFRLLSLPDGAPAQLRDADLLVRTTSPWTLPANAAVAVHPAQTYAVARRSGHGDRVVVADGATARVLGEGWHVVARFAGADLAGASYRPVCDLAEIPAGHSVVTGSFVNVADGTGLVHLAPAFGADDLAAAQANGIAVANPIRPDGRFDERMPLIGGAFFTDVDEILVTALADRGVLFAVGRDVATRPRCWRCGTTLLSYALPSWYIRTSAAADQLLAASESIRARPPACASAMPPAGSDWMLSRTRHWGTPLPLWECEHSHVTCAGSLAELSALAGADLSGLDPHRPLIDSVVIGCPRCGTAARRVPEVIDAAYDSGSMPFAQHGAPRQGTAGLGDCYQATFVAEQADVARGWFSSLLTIGSLVFGRPAFQTALCLGDVTDEHGTVMSKSAGNVISPLPLFERYGADAVRWYFVASEPPTRTRRFCPDEIAAVTRNVLLPWWSAAAFFVEHAHAAAARGSAWPRAGGAPPPAGRPLLDRWLLSELHALAADVTTALEHYDPATAGRRVAGFIAAVSDWYVPVSRCRFTSDQDGEDGLAAFATLHECLSTLTRLMAPFAPFLSDYLWRVLRSGSDADSVHLASWPLADSSLLDDRLGTQMALVRRLAALGRSARESAAVSGGRPLPLALVGAAGFGDLPADLRALLAGELKVRALGPLPDGATGGDRGRPDGGQPGWAMAVSAGEMIALDLAAAPESRRDG
jgi:isoleucyl-tRNA synthetase